ncbi:MAG: hypothetical protein J1D88_05205 [Treponema sp.]|nr:hypothetical protein [Treponema sp.]
MVCKRFFVLAFISLCAVAHLYADSDLPSGYAGITLGMSVDEVKKALADDPQFGYRGERDVSLLPGEQRTIIETDTSRLAPYSYLERCWFQFYEDKLYIITINIKKEKVDHYSIFNKLCKKYGNPQSLNPRKSEWKNDSVIMALERPLSLKYTDKAVSDSLQEKSTVQKSAEEMSRDDFLNGL